MSGAAIYFDGKWKSQSFTSNGTFNVPDSVDAVFVEMYGGGGGGQASSSDAYGGEASKGFFGMVAVTAGGSVGVTIGSGGIGVQDSPGTDGTASSFGGITCPGGRGGGSQGPIGGQGRPGARAAGGSNAGTTTEIGYGGDGAYAAGGNGVRTSGTPGNGGRGAGGGGFSNASLVTGGNGGAGICVVWYKEN